MHPSKGKRDKKRKRKESRLAGHPDMDRSNVGGPGPSGKEPPAICKHLTIGFNSTMRYLEARARVAAPKDRLAQAVTPPERDASQTAADAVDDHKPLAAVFIPHSAQSSIMYSHLPLLVKAASLASPSHPTTRLVKLPKGAEERLSAVLSIPRTALIGLLDGAPKADILIDFIRRNVPGVEIPWFDEAARGAYMPVNIKAVHTDAPAKLKKDVLLRKSPAEED